MPAICQTSLATESNRTGVILKAPFCYFGGKSLIAERVWQIFGSGLQNYVEPFAGSLAVMLARPVPFDGPETAGDWSCHVVNFWRAIQGNPWGLAKLCVGPCFEVNTEAQHNHIVQGADALRTLLGNPLAYDLRSAAYWVRGVNEWIGSGYASGEGPWVWNSVDGWFKRGDEGTGINRKLPHLGNDGRGEVQRRTEWLVSWFQAIADRLVKVRFACGDWKRIADSDSATIKHGLTGFFLDPPYDDTEYVYGADHAPVSAEVREWCKENGRHPLKRIILCGRGTEHDELLQHGYRREDWVTGKGYGKPGQNGEVIWHNCQAAECNGQMGFDW
jgi:DNA adenine methylase